MFTPYANGRSLSDETGGGQPVDVQVVSLDDVHLPPFVARARRMEAPTVDGVWRDWAANSRIVPLPGEPVVRGTALQVEPVPPTQKDLETLAALDLNRRFTSIAAFKAETRRIVEQSQQNGLPILEQPSFPQEELGLLRQTLRLPPG